ncbi:TPA: hypothetical protein ACH3X3_011159 [Trebouxia sp. C0006]
MQIVVSDVGATIPGINSTEDKLGFLYEACSASLKDELNTAKVPVAIKAAGVDADGHWTRQNLAQVIWLIGQEVTGQEALFTKLKDLVQDLQKAALVGKSELLEVAPVHFLAELGVVPQTSNAKTDRTNRLKADLFYKLNKFNALREENEGFSKMLVCLQGFGAAAAAKSDDIPQLMLEITSLIGYFDLDPNRVAALVLDIFQDQWNNEAYLLLLPLFSQQAVTASLAFIYAHYQAEGEMAPDNLYRMTVQLIKANAVKLDALWVHMSPDDATLKNLQTAAQISAVQNLQARNNLNKDISQIDFDTAKFGLSAEQFNLDPRELLTTVLQPVWANNQKLELLRIAFEMEEVDLAWPVYKGLKSVGLEPADYPAISAWMAKKVLSGLSPAPAQAESVPLPVMSPDAESMLNMLGLAFSTSNELWVRLTRHWKQYLLHHLQEAEASNAGATLPEEAVSKVCSELVQRLIPGMSLMSPNPFFAAELWSLLELLPYSKRYELYEDTSRLLKARTGENMDAICLKAAADNVYRLTKRIASRMGFDKDSGRIETAGSKKDKEKQFRGLSRNFGKVSHCNPVIVAEYLVAYAQNNGTHIDSLTDVMVDLSDVVLDIITYRVIRTFTMATNRYKPDEVLISDHLAFASRFAAMAARKLTPDSKRANVGGIELHALLQFVLNAGLKSHGEVFVILGDLIDVCAAVHILEDVGDTELPSLAGGDVLRTVKIISKEVRLSSKVAKAGMERLCAALTSTQGGRALAVPLFVVLAQNRALHIVGQDKGVGQVDPTLRAEDRIRVVSDRFDQANRLLVQYADFLRLALDKVTYRDLMPLLADLLDPEKYGLEPAVAFLLYRPVLSRVPFPAPPSPKDEEDGEIPEGDQVPMEVEQETSFGEVRWSHLLQAVDATLPSDTKKGLTKQFYLLFWRLTFSDISNASPEYDKQIRLLQREVKDAEEEAVMCNTATTAGAYGQMANPKYISSSEDRKLALKHYKNKQDMLKDQIRLLERERSKMEERRREGVHLFRHWKDHLLADADHSKTIPAFIGHCLLPRCMMTPEDAMYCAAFIRRLTLEDTPYFSFMLCAQLLVPTGLTMLYTMTEREADNFGIFYREVLSTVKGWWVNQEELKGLLPRQGFRRDGKLFVLPAETAKHADAQIYGAFVQQLQGQTATKFVEIFKANAKNNVNLRAAGNALLVLNKIKTVCPMMRHNATAVVSHLKPIFTRLEPPKDAQGNFMEAPVPLYNLAFRCHTDLNNTVQANAKFDSGTTSNVPAIRLYDRTMWDPQYSSRPTPAAPPPQRRPPSAAAKPAAPVATPASTAAAAPAATAAATPAAAEAPAAGTTPAAAAADSVRQDAAATTRAPRDGGARASTTGRGSREPAGKEPTSHRASKEATARDGTALREGKEPAVKDSRDTKEPAARDGSDAAGTRGRDGSTRGGKEHNDRGTTSREGRDGSRAAAATGKAADDKQLAEVRAAALKRQSSVNGEAANGSRKGSPVKREEATKGGKAAVANGLAAASGTKRRAPDLTPAETRGAKAAKTDAAAAPQAEAAKSSAAAPPGLSTTRRTETTAGDISELRSDAPEFKPTPKHAADAPAKRPTATADKRLKADQEKPSGAASDKPSGSSVKKPVETAADKPSGVSARPPVHPESSPRTATKRARESDSSAEAAKNVPSEVGKAAGDEQQPKRLKRKPIAWAPPPAAADTQEPSLRHTSGEKREESAARVEPRRTASEVARASSNASSEAKQEQRDVRAKPEEDRRRTRSDVAREPDDRKHAQRDGPRAEPDSRQAQRDSKREPEAERAQRGSHRDAMSPRDLHRHKGPDDASRRSSADKRQSSLKSDDRKATAVVSVPSEEQEDGEVQMAEPAAKPAPERVSEQNGLAVADSRPASPVGQDTKDDSDGKESKRSHRKGHKKDKKEHKDKDKKRKHREKKEHKEKDPEKEKAKAEKKAEKAAAAADKATADVPASIQPVAAAKAASPVPKAADTAAGAPAVSRLASSIAKPGNTASPTAASRPEPRLSGGTREGGREGSDPAPASSSRQPALASSAPRQVPSRMADGSRDVEDSAVRLGRGDRRDGSGERNTAAGSNSAAEAAPQPDLRDKLRKKRKAEQTSRPEPQVVKQGMPSRHQKSQQPSGHAPRHWP